MARSVFIDLIGHDRASGAFNTAAASADRAAARMSSASAKMTRAGAAMTRSITVPVVAAIAVSAKLATDFNTSMTRIQTQAGASARDVQVLSKQVLNLKNAQQGPNELAKALYHLKSVGMTNKSAMSALRQSMNLANVSGASLEDTTNALAGAWRTGIKGATDFKGTVSSLNAIIGSGNMTATDLIGALGTGILPTAKTFGLTIRDVGAALALFTDEGVPADAAATRIRMSFSLLGAGSAAAEKQLKGIGLTSLRLNEDMRKPNGLLVAITDLKKHLDDSGLSAARQSQVLSHAFGGGRSSSGILSMINNLDVLGQKYTQQAHLAGQFGKAVAAQAKTPAAQFHELSAELQKTGVLLGNAVLPYLVTLAKDLTGVVQGFSNLSGTQKKILAWSIGILAALGPLMTIGGRLLGVAYSIGRFVSLTSAGLARLSGVSAASAARFGTAMGGITGAMVGGGIGYAVGTFTRNSSTAVKWLGALGSAAAGAAIGFQMGGPLGAALGGIAGGVVALGTAFSNTGASAKIAAMLAQRGLQAQTQSAQELYGELMNVNGAYGANYKAQVAGRLAQSGLYTQAQGFGIGPAQLLNEVMGTGTKTLANFLLEVGKSKGILENAGYQKFIADIQGISLGAAKAEINFEQMRRSTGDAIVSASLLAGGSRNLSRELMGTGHALHYANGANTDMSASARRNTEVIRENTASLVAQAQAQINHGKSVQAATGWLHSQVAVLEMTLHSLGFNFTAIQKVIGALHLYGGLHPKPLVEVNTDAAMSKTRLVGSALYALNKQKADPTVNVNGAYDVINTLNGIITRMHIIGQGVTETINVVTKTGTVHARAAGGGAPEGWFWTGERGPELVRKDGAAVHVFSNPQSRALAPSLGTRVPGFANGTSSAAAQTQSAAVGTVRGDFGPLLGSLRGTIVDLRTAFWAMFRDARSAHTSKDVLDGITASYRRLIPMIERRNALTAQLTKAETALAAVRAKYAQVWTTSRDASMGSFDITTAGGSQFTDRPGTTAGSILANLRATAAKAGQFRTVLARLVKEGLNRNLVAQLAAAGPAALAQAQALAASTPAQMRSLNSAYSGLSVTSSAIGKLAATDMYGAGVASAQGLVNGLRSRQTVLNAAIARIANGMIAQLKRTLGIHSPSRVMYGLAGHTVEGYRRGIVDRLDDVRRAGKDMGNAAVPNSQNGAWARTDVRGNGHTFNIYEQPNAEAAAVAVMRRLDMPGYAST